jgi:hypothetical protein
MTHDGTACRWLMPIRASLHELSGLDLARLDRFEQFLRSRPADFSIDGSLDPDVRRQHLRRSVSHSPPKVISAWPYPPSTEATVGQQWRSRCSSSSAAITMSTCETLLALVMDGSSPSTPTLSYAICGCRGFWPERLPVSP